VKVEGLKVKIDPLEPPKEPIGGASDDIGDISWNVPTVYLRYPANIPNLPGHSWENAVAMATPIAHKVDCGREGPGRHRARFPTQAGSGQADVDLFQFNEVQIKETKYVPLISPSDQPALS
jgi:aminobenzoyl-glutamate utilization protein B